MATDDNVSLLREVAARHKLDTRTLQKALRGDPSLRALTLERAKPAVAEYRARLAQQEAGAPAEPSTPSDPETP